MGGGRGTLVVMEDGSLKEAFTGGRADPLGVDGRN
jgi:hypothetical protein